MMDVGRAGDGSNSSGRAAARNVAAGKSVGGERPGKEPSIYQWQAAGSLGSRLRYHNLRANGSRFADRAHQTVRALGQIGF